ncbi:MAG TPA: methylmalonyl Co-A mutase-associated GTPase MeaB [Roseiflexaceae bacterium]|nr:methylmalonyl Co-A mutase-associated GTPase MeaB [Roseiflexaceae bacterium]HMP42748.1 methylmalonyl Co-A mutase-associated GTPase MeaB [Roseiflexaceae bacterium]
MRHDRFSKSSTATCERRAAINARRQLSSDEIVAGVQAGNRAILARAITLIESRAEAHQALAQEVLQQLLPYSGRSIRIGITGAPGVGKSTLIEALGLLLIAQGRRPAVLAVDPSSSRTHGSILGDKTRMEQLTRAPEAFIRPTAAGNTLGGVARRTRETIMLCEAAGFDTIIVETVGVGQSEIAVRAMVDCFVLLLLAGGGDELQGIKKGIVEIADLLLITKADGAHRELALGARAEYMHALRYLAPAESGWRPPVQICSAMSGEGIDTLWETIKAHEQAMRAAGFFTARRRQQAEAWFDSLIEEGLRAQFMARPGMAGRLRELRAAVGEGTLTAVAAAERILDA